MSNCIYNYNTQLIGPTLINKKSSRTLFVTRKPTRKDSNTGLGYFFCYLVSITIGIMCFTFIQETKYQISPLQYGYWFMTLLDTIFNSGPRHGPAIPWFSKIIREIWTQWTMAIKRSKSYLIISKAVFQILADTFLLINAVYILTSKFCMMDFFFTLNTNQISRSCNFATSSKIKNNKLVLRKQVHIKDIEKKWVKLCWSIIIFKEYTMNNL